MHNTAERSLIAKIFTATAILLSLALLAFLIKYSRDNLYVPATDTYYRVNYFDVDQQYDSVVLAANEIVELPQLEKKGHTFAGWCFDKDGTLKAPKDTVVGSELQLYAQWDVNRYTVLVHPNYQGAAPYNELLYYGDDFQINSPTRTGYTFLGWFMDAEGSISLNVLSMPDHDVEVYAKWSINNYRLRMLVNTDQVPAIQDTNVQYGDSVVVPTLEREGYTFEAWCTDYTLKNQFVSGSPMPDANLTLYAKWTANKYPISFVTNGGSAIEDLSLDYESDISDIELPTTQRAGYDFVHWYVDPLDENTPYVFDKMPLDGLTVYAKWSPREDTAYKIEHYFENEEGEFVRDDDQTENLIGTTGQYRYISAKTFEGFDFDDDNYRNYTDGEIKGDGTTVFKFYYRKI